MLPHQRHEKTAAPSESSSSSFWSRALLLGAFLFGTTTTLAEGAAAQTADRLPEDLTEVGIEKLLDFDLVVTSPGKKRQTLSNVASAVYVVTNEDIRRAGVTHVAEALRLVPGVDVARVSATQWAVSIRGFNQVFANKLLVLIDGISVFSPLTNGVYWESLDPMLEDIDRIEVIRGPGAALWGANAVNGVVNIITKSADKSLGNFVTAGGGTHERAFGSAQAGFKLSEDSAMRLSVKYTDRGNNELRAGGDANDDWDTGSVDGRYDSKITDRSTLSIIGHAYSLDNFFPTITPSFEPPFVDPTTYSGTAHWKGAYTGAHYQNNDTETSSIDLGANLLYQEYEAKLIDYHYVVYEMDGSRRFALSESQELMYGGSLRLFSNSTNGTFAESVDPENRTTRRINVFVQHDQELGTPDVHLILGTKLEENESTGFEFMPNARVIWTPTEHQSVWASVSRAVAPPSLVFEDITIPAAYIPPSGEQPGALVTLFGDRGVVSEDLIAYELGYRADIGESFSLDVAGFYNDYDNVLSQEPGAPYVGALPGAADSRLIVPLQFANEIRAEASGGEVAIEYRPSTSARLIVGYAYLNLNATQGNSLDADEVLLIEGGSARHKVVARGLYNLTSTVTLDTTLRFVDELRLGTIPSYGDADVRLGWAATKQLELSVVGQNLLNGEHPEYVGNLFGTDTVLIERGVYGKLTYRF